MIFDNGSHLLIVYLTKEHRCEDQHRKLLVHWGTAPWAPTE